MTLEILYDENENENENEKNKNGTKSRSGLPSTSLLNEYSHELCTYDIDNDIFYVLRYSIVFF